jgi:hypothetical protein
MEKSLSEILENQLKFKEQIFEFFAEDYNKTTKKLRTMKTQSEFIEEEREKLLKKYKLKKAMKSVENYFMIGLSDYDKIMGRIQEKNKNKNFAVLWNETTKEAEIIKINEKKTTDEKTEKSNNTGIS